MMKIYDKKLAYPYFVWMTLFTVVPLFIVGYYALTDSEGHFTLDNQIVQRKMALAVRQGVVPHDEQRHHSKQCHPYKVRVRQLFIVNLHHGRITPRTVP